MTALLSDGLSQEIHDWADETFPHQSIWRLALHLSEEGRDLDAALIGGDRAQIQDNVADCAILLSELVARVKTEADAWGIDVESAAEEKHTVNVGRRWRYDPLLGYDRHVPEEAA